MRKFLKIISIISVLIVLVLFALSFRHINDDVTYGASFSKLHSDELNLPWKVVYVDMLEDLRVKNLRLTAHWPMVEPENNHYNFEELDFQMTKALEYDASVILAIGRRVPGWPECHVPSWASDMNEKEFRVKQLEYMRAVVERYKDFPNLRYWQVENEPFLHYAVEQCRDTDEEFLKEEVEFVKNIDPEHEVITTDSGEFGFWYRVRRHGDVFGTTLYKYIWHGVLGPIDYPVSPAFFRVKQNIFDIIRPRPAILIELGLEPWLPQPIVDTPIPEQRARMGLDKFDEIIKFSKLTGFDEQYLWGVEWWYWMREQGHDEYWDRAKELYKE